MTFARAMTTEPMTTKPATPAVPLPARPFRWTMLAPTLLVSVAAPIVVFKGLEAAGVAPAVALAAGCVPPVLNNLRVWITSRRLDPVGLLTMAAIAGGPIASLISGAVASRIVTDCILNAAWGSAFLGSLLLARPVLFYLISGFAAGDDAARTAIWNGLWGYAAFRRTMRSMTAMWGAFYLAVVLIELELARSLSAETVVTIAPLLGVGSTLALIALTRRRMRQLRERFEQLEAVKWPL